MADDPIPSPLETLKMKLPERQENEYRELLSNQDRRERMMGDAPSSMIEMHERQRVEQQQKFNDELEHNTGDTFGTGEVE